MKSKIYKLTNTLNKMCTNLGNKPVIPTQKKIVLSCSIDIYKNCFTEVIQ
jgi:hypothetical protein